MDKEQHVAVRMKNGLEFETVFYSNPKSDSRFRFRATHLGGCLSNKGAERTGGGCLMGDLRKETPDTAFLFRRIFPM